MKTHELVLKELGYVLDEHQPHTKGERFLMQAVTTKSGKKLILYGTYKEERVVIKITNDEAGKEELRHERMCRDVLKKIGFAYNTFHTPTEILFKEKHGYLVFAQEFIPQEKQFIERPLDEQFSFALRALKAQENTRATTHEHEMLVKKTFGSMNADAYCTTLSVFQSEMLKQDIVSSYHPLLEQAVAYVCDRKEIMEQYGGFLTHTDFVPHNFRIKGDTLYLLDVSSLRFGNKYEGWARFLNFMLLYNRPLEEALTEYVKNNRVEEEHQALQSMRVYRLAEIMLYYSRTLPKSSGNLLTLNTHRVHFWASVLESCVSNARVEDRVIDEYKRIRDELRDDEEKERQKNLH